MNCHSGTRLDLRIIIYYIPYMICIGPSDRRPLSLRHASNLLQAVGHPIRLQILHALRAGPVSVGEIVGVLALEQPVVSRHLAILRQQQIVRVTASGRQRHYQLAGRRIQPLLDVLFSDDQPTTSETDTETEINTWRAA